MFRRTTNSKRSFRVTNYAKTRYEKVVSGEAKTSKFDQAVRPPPNRARLIARVSTRNTYSADQLLSDKGSARKSEPGKYLASNFWTSE